MPLLPERRRSPVPAWGRILHEEVYEDTQRVAAFDVALGIAPAAPVPAV